MTTVSSPGTRLVNTLIIVPAPTHNIFSNATAASTDKPEEPQSKVEEAITTRLPDQTTTTLIVNRKKYPKDDYQKNITINVVKCCIR